MWRKLPVVVDNTADEEQLRKTALPETSILNGMAIRARDAGAAESDGSDNTTLVITLSTVLSVVFVAFVVLTVYYCSRRGRRRRPGLGGLFRRGITPIGDDEIATWRLNRPEDDRDEEKYTTRSGHTPNASTSTRKAPSVIQYPNGGRPSEEAATIASPVAPSFKRSASFDLPRMPESAVLAVAPNARTGLTDDTVPGDEPFLPPTSPTSPRRTTSSRLHKYPPGSPRNFHHHQNHYHHRPRGSRSSSLKSASSPHHSSAFGSGGGGVGGGSSRPSAEMPAPPEVPSPVSASHPPLRKPSYDEDDDRFTGLSPPPSRRTPAEEIGRALG